MAKDALQIAIPLVYMAAGLFATLSGFNIIRPFKNHEQRRREIEKHRAYYRYGGMLLIAYGTFRLLT